jgi:hypothetical protein
LLLLLLLLLLLPVNSSRFPPLPMPLPVPMLLLLGPPFAVIGAPSTAGARADLAVCLAKGIAEELEVTACLLLLLLLEFLFFAVFVFV